MRSSPLHSMLWTIALTALAICAGCGVEVEKPGSSAQEGPVGAMDGERVKEILSLPAGVEPLYLIPVGFPER